MNDKTTLPVKFEWTDDLVFEYANTVLNDHAAGRRPMNVENFVRLKDQSYKQPDTKEKGSRIDEIKAFEKWKNTWDAPLYKWTGEMLDEYYNSGMYIEQFRKSKLPTFPKQKTYTQAELEEAESKAWGSAREYNSGCWFSPEFMKYPTLEDYRKSLSSINKEDEHKYISFDELVLTQHEKIERAAAFIGKYRNDDSMTNHRIAHSLLYPTTTMNAYKENSRRKDKGNK